MHIDIPFSKLSNVFADLKSFLPVSANFLFVWQWAYIEELLSQLSLSFTKSSVQKPLSNVETNMPSTA